MTFFARLSRYLPLAFMKREDLTIAELRKQLGTGDAKPIQRYPANKKKLAMPRMSVVKKRA